MKTIYNLMLAIILLTRSMLLDILSSEPIISSTYECLSGKNPDTMTRKEILKEFAKGPCSPLIISPALLSTKIVVEIDCQTLQAENPYLFSLCGWNACEKHFYDIWKSVPLPEYHLWIPSFTGPLSIFQYKEEKNLCWANFVILAIDTTKPITDSVIERKGFKVSVYGQSKETEKFSQCGDAANKNLLGYEWIEIRKTRYLKYLYDRLKAMGYVAGLTYQTIPYDFRLSYRANQINKLFVSNLKRLNKLTDKKVVILGHSLGNINIYHQLINLDRETKQKTIKNWVSVGSALGGALQGANALVAGDNEFMYLKNMVGIHFHAEIIAFHHMISGYELLPIDFFTYHKDEGWLKAFEKRIQYEKGVNTYEDSGFNFLPKVEDKCSPATFINYPTDCRMGFFDYRDQYIIKIQDNEFKVNDMEKMLTQYNMTESTLSIYKHTRDNDLYKLSNPEVPVISINLRTGLTVEQYDYDRDVRDYLNTHDYPSVKSSKIGYGDGVLSSTTQYAGPLKWAFEYDTNAPNSYPVKFIDLCSTYNVKYDVYDNKDSSKEYDMKKNEFIGVACECMASATAEACNHPTIMIDKYVLDLMVNVLVTNEVSFSDSYDSFVDSLDEQILNDMTTSCPQLKDGYSGFRKMVNEEGFDLVEE